MKLYGQATSGNCWKIRLLLNFLRQSFDYQSLDTVKGETQENWYQQINPVGKIPCLVLDDGETLIESNAILWRLAQSTPWWPDDLSQQSRVLSWLFWEQYSHEPALAVARSWKVYRGWDQERPEAFADLIAKSHEALSMLNMQLTYTNWLATDQPTIADISLYPYTAMVADAGIDTSAYPGVQAWLTRFAALEGYVLISDIPRGAAPGPR